MPSPEQQALESEIESDRHTALTMGYINTVKSLRDKYGMGLTETSAYVNYLRGNEDTPLRLMDGHRAFLGRRRP